jgi:hypothetical protein
MINLHCRVADVAKFSMWGITKEPGHTGREFVGVLTKRPSTTEMEKLAQDGVPFWIGHKVDDVIFAWISDGSTVEASRPTGSVEDNLPYRLAYERLDTILYASVARDNQR